MPNKILGDDIKTRVKAMIDAAEEDVTVGPLSLESRATLTDALTQHFEAPTEGAGNAERIAKLEAQTRVLADAVVAIAEPSFAVAPAVEAVKIEMSQAAPLPTPDSER